MHILNYEIQAKDNQIIELNNCLLAISKEVALLEACQMYMITKIKEHENVFQITEIWDDELSYDNSLSHPNRSKLWDQAQNFILNQDINLTVYTVVGGYFNLGNE